MRQPRMAIRGATSPESEVRRRHLRPKPVARRRCGNPKAPNDRNAPNEPNPTHFSWLSRSKWANPKHEARSTKQIRNPKGSNDRNAPNEANSRVSRRPRKRGQVQPAAQNVPVPVFVAPSNAPNEPNFPCFWLENAGLAEKQSQFMERRTGGLSPLCGRPVPHRTGRLSPLTLVPSGFIMTGSERNLEPGFLPDRPLVWPNPCDEPLGIRDLRSQIPVGQEFD